MCCDSTEANRIHKIGERGIEQCTLTEICDESSSFLSEKTGKCVPLNICKPGQIEKSPPTKYSDRGCAEVGVCDADGTFASDSGLSTEPICRALKQCAVNEYESAQPTRTTDRECTTHSTCSDNHYETSPPTPTSDRSCTPLTVCAVTYHQIGSLLGQFIGGTYTAISPTPTTDRECASCKCEHGQKVANCTSENGVTECTECGFYETSNRTHCTPFVYTTIDNCNNFVEIDSVVRLRPGWFFYARCRLLD